MSAESPEESSHHLSSDEFGEIEDDDSHEAESTESSSDEHEAKPEPAIGKANLEPSLQPKGPFESSITIQNLEFLSQIVSLYKKISWYLKNS